jgi:phosphoribosylamine--glycine ligase
MNNQRVLVVGGGGREHALCMSLQESPSVNELHCAPGNAGTALLATNHAVSAGDVDALVDLASTLDVHLVVAGPEAPLCDGLSDQLAKQGIPCFGPVASLAMLEGSKLHAKSVMKAAGVPTAAFHVLSADADIDLALDDFSGQPWVVKRDVLAGGKGVVVTSDRKEAFDFIHESIQSDGQVLLEAFLPGEEASMLVVMDGSGFVCLPPSQDHKRAYDGDLGPNTGGMGAYCPAPVATPAVLATTVAEIVEPMHRYLCSQPVPYRGVLYVGLMITESGAPSVVEFNVRFGDPECQITLPLIETDVFQLLNHAANDRLNDLNVSFKQMHALTVVLAAEGYPASPVKGRQISGVPVPQEHAWISHAGTGVDETGHLVSTGGRVLSATALGTTLEQASVRAYELLSKVQLEGAHYRNDIGHRAL